MDGRLGPGLGLCQPLAPGTSQSGRKIERNHGAAPADQASVVTIDAIGCQTDIAHLIVKQEGDYVLAVKGNQGNLHHDVQDLSAYAREIDYQDVAHHFHKTVNGGHGRMEMRREKC